VRSFFDIQSYIERVEKDPSLYEEKNFANRVEVMDQLEVLQREGGQPDGLLLLQSRAEKVRSELEGIDTTLFFKIKAAIRTGGPTGEAFKRLVAGYVDFRAGCSGQQGEPGYDNLDIFINGLIFSPAMPEQTKALEPEMVYYQKTPARVIFELVGKAHFRKEDVFVDLGSGLGQAAILVNLLAGVVVKGIEFEPAFCDYARDCAAALNLSRVTFINVDAREADYSEGTVFFMYTPFRGAILRDVLEVLRKESLRRKIKIITYGPCTAEVALESWLEVVSGGGSDLYMPGVFSSFQG
jgi:SAM-dependent methyltransferase